MKAKRILSMLSACVMTATMLPNLPQLAIPASADHDYNLTIDFDYETKNGITTPQQALQSIGASTLDVKENAMDWEKAYNSVNWQQVTHSWTARDLEKGALRTFLTSEKPEDKSAVVVFRPSLEG